MFGLGVDGLGLLQSDGEDLLFAAQGARVGALLEVRPIASVLSGDLGAVGGRAHHAWQGEQLESIVEGDGLEIHRLEQAGGARLHLALGATLLAVLGGRLDDLGGLVVVEHLGDVGTETAIAGHDRTVAVRVQPELAILTVRACQQLLGSLDGEFVGGKGVVDVGPVALGVLDVGAIATHPDDDGVSDREGADGPGVDVPELGDELVQSLVALGRRRDVTVVGLGLAEVEGREHRDAVSVAARNLIEGLLHVGGELVVDEIGEVFLEQPGDGEGQPGRNEGRSLLEDVVTAGNGADDRGVGRRTADLQLLEFRHQTGLGVAGRRTCVVTVGRHLARIQVLALRELGQALLGVVGGSLVDRLDVGAQEAVEGDGTTGCREGGSPDVTVGNADRGGRGGADRHRESLALGVSHLGGQGSHPDELVELELVAGQAGLGRGAEVLAGGTDGLVGLLGVLDLGGVDARLVRDVVGTVELSGLAAGRTDGLLGQGHRVGTHVGDVAALVKLLGHRHGALGGEAEFTAGLLLQGRGAERSVRTTGVRLGLDLGDGERGLLQGLRDGGRGGLVEAAHLGGEVAVGVEVASGSDLGVVQGDETSVELIGLGGQNGLHVPVIGAGESHPFTLTVDDQTGRHRLHTTGGQPRKHFLPQHWGDLVAIETVKDASGLLSVDEVGVKFTGVGDGLVDSLLGDLVEDHPAHRNLGLEFVEQMPGNGLSLAVTIGGEQKFVGLLEQALELTDRRPLLRGDDVDGSELVVNIDAGARPGLTLVLGGHLGGAGGQISHVTLAGSHGVLGPQVPGNHRGLVG